MSATPDARVNHIDPITRVTVAAPVPNQPHQAAEQALAVHSPASAPASPPAAAWQRRPQVCGPGKPRPVAEQAHFCPGAPGRIDAMAALNAASVVKLFQRAISES